MKYEFQIVTALENHHFIHHLENRLKWITQKDYFLQSKTWDSKENDTSTISLCLQGKHEDGVFRDEDIICVFKHQMSEVLAEHIVNNWEERLVYKAIQRHYRIFDDEDRKIVYTKASEFLRKCHYNESINMLMNFGRKNRMAYKLLEYIDNNDLLVVEGFINFCLPDYLSEIKFAVELAVEEMKNEKEYNEFVKLLRYFVDTQVPRVFEVNLLMDKDGVFYLWDGQGEKIEEKYLDYYLDDMLLNEVNLDDILISILITIAPRRIVIHNIENIASSEPVKMIKNVFQDKIIVCKGCERCWPYKENKLRQ